MSSTQNESFPNGQFLRLEKYSRVAGSKKSGSNTIYKIAAEAMRINGFCDHIASPVAPTIIFGVGPTEAVLLAEEWVTAQHVKYLHKRSNTIRTRKFRSDSACAVVGVISVPPAWSEDARWKDFTDTSIDWLQSRFGNRLKSAIAHFDERCLHLHFWLIPEQGETIGSVHAGEAAIEAVGKCAPRVVRDNAYKSAMACMLDDFQIKVTNKFDLLRRTINQRRLSRQEWIRQKWLAFEKKSLIETNDSLIVNSAMQQQDTGKKVLSCNEFPYSDTGFSKATIMVGPRSEMTEFNTQGLGIFGQWIIAPRQGEEVRNCSMNPRLVAGG